MPPPVFPANGSLLAAPPFPPSGPGEARFPALSGSMKALRLPIPHPQSLIGSLPRSTRSSCSSCPPWRSWKRGGRFQTQAVGCRPPVVPVSASGRKWDLSGLQTVLPVPLLRSTTPVEPMRPCHPGHLGAAPATHTAKASTTADIGANPQLQHTLSTLHEPRYRRPCKTRFRLAGCAFPGRASIPQNRYERFQFVLFFILLSCSPDANGSSPFAKPITRPQNIASRGRRDRRQLDDRLKILIARLRGEVMGFARGSIPPCALLPLQLHPPHPPPPSPPPPQPLPTSPPLFIVCAAEWTDA